MTTLPNKKVSVIVPNYNYGRYIRKRIRSILRQTYPVYEIIVLDDASTDGSAEMIKSMVLDLKAQNPNLNIRFVGNKENSGKAMKQWKKGIELATGDYIWIAEADDLCSRRFLEEVMKGFEDPEVVLSYTESAIINGAGVMIAPNFRWSRDKEKTGHYKKSYVKEGFREIEEIMAVRCTIPNVSAVVFRKDVIDMSVLGKAIEFSQVGDWYLYVNVLKNGKVVYNRKALNKFRVHRGSKTADAKNDRVHYDEIVNMHKWLAVKFNLDEFVTRRMMMEEKRIAKRMKISN